MIKVFKFEISNCTRAGCDERDLSASWYINNVDKVVTPETIENTINEFCETVANVIDIKVNEVVINNHNNGRGNKVELWYSIIYTDIKSNKKGGLVE